MSPSKTDTRTLSNEHKKWKVVNMTNMGDSVNGIYILKIAKKNTAFKGPERLCPFHSNVALSLLADVLQVTQSSTLLHSHCRKPLI